MLDTRLQSPDHDETDRQGGDEVDDVVRLHAASQAGSRQAVGSPDWSASTFALDNRHVAPVDFRALSVSIDPQGSVTLWVVVPRYLSEWVISRSSENGIGKSTFVRMKLIEARRAEGEKL